MPTIQQNLRLWNAYDWSRGGDEWSSTWGGSDNLWWGTLLPRIHAFLPAAQVLEIGPGFGRWSHYLQRVCEHLTAVDISPRCIEACTTRFANSSNVAFFVNDGRTLSMVEDGSVDFTFSFDSLVHADADVIRDYLIQLRAKLSPNGVGFIHHSNVGTYLAPLRRLVPRKLHSRVVLPISRRINPYWRGEDMTADLFFRFCGEAGLACLTQEAVNWGGRLLTDCFSTFAREASRWPGPLRRVRNKRFMHEASAVARVGTLYARDAAASASAPGRSPVAF